MRCVWVAGALAYAALVTGLPAIGQDFVIRGATVHTVAAQGSLKNTDVLVRGGVIAAVAPHLRVAADIPVIEAGGRPLTPGLFGGLTDIGLDEVAGESQTVNSTLDTKAPAWQQQWRPELDVSLAFNPRSVYVPVTRVEGVTWTVLVPGNGDSIMAGQGAAVSLDGRLNPLLRGGRVLFVQMGSDGARRAGGTRAAEYMLLDQAVSEARAPGSPGEGALLHAEGRRVLARFLAGGRVVFGVDRAADILAVVAFARRNGMTPVIAGGAEAWVVAQELASAHVAVILDPLEDLPHDFDRLGARLDNAARLQRAGVRIAFSSGESQYARLTRQLAGNAVAHGLSWDAALAAITANPAEMFGLGALRGRISVGSPADLVLWSADPLEISTLADQVWIAGHSMSTKSRQTELRDRYVEKVRAHQAR